MRFCSTRDPNYFVSAKDAILSSLCPKGGLFIPEKIPQNEALKFASELSLAEIGYQVAKSFFSELFADQTLKQICKSAFNFDAPLVNLSEELSVLELTHGPSLAFKDFGARFMAECLSQIGAQQISNYHVLTATSGDTGGAVAAALYEKENVTVTILFPKNKISKFQEGQMTKWGKNIRTVAVNGTFDDCQKLVKQAFSNPDVTTKVKLISANSINISRLIAQMVYYISALVKVKDRKDLIFAVPCGNLGNLTAGLWAAEYFGSAVKFVAAHNLNASFPKYLETGNYAAKASVSTYSNAMDVGAPSNFERIKILFSDDYTKVKQKVSSYVINDQETISEMQSLYQRFKYFACPHTAVALAAAEKVPGYKIALSTADPVKFSEILNLAGLPFKFSEQTEGISQATFTIPAEFDELTKILNK